MKEITNLTINGYFGNFRVVVKKNNKKETLQQAIRAIHGENASFYEHQAKVWGF